jgi:hypothetical protein
MHQPGDVVRVFSTIAGKQKYHLCVALDGSYLFLNSPRPATRLGDLAIPCANFPFIASTPSGLSVICCSTIVKLSSADQRKAVVLGRCDKAVLLAVLKFVEDNEVLTPEETDLLIDSLSAWA